MGRGVSARCDGSDCSRFAGAICAQTATPTLHLQSAWPAEPDGDGASALPTTILRHPVRCCRLLANPSHHPSELVVSDRTHCCGLLGRFPRRRFRWLRATPGVPLDDFQRRRRRRPSWLLVPLLIWPDIAGTSSGHTLLVPLSP